MNPLSAPKQNNEMVRLRPSELSFPSAPILDLEPARPAPSSEYLARNQRADSFLNSLTPDQQNQLFNWLSGNDSLRKIADTIAAPPPRGFGVKVHHTSLGRLRSMLKSVEFQAKQEEVFDSVQDMEKTTDFSQSHRVLNAITQMLQQQAFELARTEPQSPAFIQLLQSIEKLSELEFKRQKLHLEREKVLRQSSNAPRQHRVELNIVPPELKPAIPADPAPLPEKS